MAIALAALGLTLLVFAADQLVVGAGRLALRLRVTPVVVGVVVIGVGTSAPEMLVSGVAAAQGDVGIAVGNLVGSNIINVTLILGVAALVLPIAVHSSVVRREAPLATIAVVIFAGLILIGLGRVVGAVLAVATVATLVLLVRLARETPDKVLPAEVGEFLDEGTIDEQVIDERALDEKVPGAVREPVRALLGLIGTLAGAQLLVTNAADIAEQIGVPQVVIGTTLVAIGTSLPELVTAVQAQRRGESDLVVGNLLGSNLFNSLAGGAAIGLLAPAGAGSGVPTTLLVAMVVVMLLTWVVLYRGGRVSRVEGVVLLVAYLATLPLLV